MTSALELTPTAWETMERHKAHAEANHQKARAFKGEAHELLAEAEDHANLATQVEQRALSRLEQWHHYDRRFSALCESIDELEAKRVAHATQARLIHQQIDQAHDEAHAQDGDDVRKAILIEKAELIEREGRNRIDLEVRMSAEAEQAQAQQQEAEEEAEDTTTP